MDENLKDFMFVAYMKGHMDGSGLAANEERLREQFQKMLDDHKAHGIDYSVVRCYRVD